MKFVLLGFFVHLRLLLYRMDHLLSRADERSWVLSCSFPCGNSASLVIFVSIPRSVWT